MTTDNASVGGDQTVPQPTPKKKRLWWKILLGLIVIVLLVVATAPMIVSSGPVRAFALSKVNAQLAGRLEVQDWSFAWLGGQSLQGIKLYDQQNRLVLEVSRIQTPATLLSLARGNYDLGRTEIADLNLTQLEIGPAGQTNYQKIFLPQGAAPAATGAKKETKAAAGQPPAVKIDLSIKPMRGTIVTLDAAGQQTAPAIEIRPESEINAKLGDLSQPITDVVKLALSVGGKPAGSINLDGSATLNLAASAVQASQKLAIQQLDLSALSPLLALAKVQGQMGGMLSGDLVVDVPSLDRGTVKGRIAGTDLRFAGPMLSGDVIQTRKLDIPVDLTLGQGQILTGGLQVVTDQGSVKVDANLPIAALIRLADGQGPGATGQAKLAVDVPNLALVLNMLKNTVKLKEGVAVSGGSLTLAVTADLTEKDVKVSVPVQLSGLTATQGTQKIGPLQPIKIQLGAIASPQGKGKFDLRDLLADLTSSFATVHAAGATVQSTQLAADVDLAKAKTELGQVFDLSMIRTGTIHVTLSSTGSLDAGQSMQPKLAVEARNLSLDLPAGTDRYTLDNGSVSVSAVAVTDGKAVTIDVANPLTATVDGKLTRGTGVAQQTLWDQQVRLTASGVASANQELSNLVVGIALPFATIKLDQVAVAQFAKTDKPDWLSLVKKAHISVSALDLGKAYAAAERFAPPAAGQAPLALAGTLNLTGDVVRDQSTSTLTLSVKADGVSVRRGTADLKLDRPVTVDLGASVKTAPGANLMSQLVSVRVDRLLSDLGPAKVQLTKPLVVADLPAAMKLMTDPKAKAGELGGAIRLTGSLGEIARLADALAGTEPGQPSVLPLAGDLTSDTELAYTGAVLGVKSKTQVASFAVMQDGKPAFSEPEVNLVSNVSLDLASHVLSMDDVSMRMTRSDAIALQVKGKVRDFAAQQVLDGVAISITPDLAKVWDIVRPLMPPEKQANIGKLVLGGKQPITVTVSGTYPSGKPYPEAIKSIKASGEFKADLIDWQQYGLKVNTLAVPFWLADGVVHTTYQTAQGTTLPSPATLNGGKLYIPDCQIDITSVSLSQVHPRLTIPANTKLIEGALLNTVFLSLVGEKVTPLFYSPTDASGRLDVTVVKCDRLPIDGFVMSTDRANDGYCQILVSATELNVGARGMQEVLKLMGATAEKGQDKILGNIRDARVTIAGGKVDHDMKLMLGQSEIGARGNLDMTTSVYSSFVADVPTTMITKLLPNANLAKFMPDRVGLTFSGPASSLKLDPKTLNNLISGAVQKQLTSGLLGGAKTSATGQGAADTKATTPQDAVGGLIDGILGGKKDQGTTAQPTDKKKKKK